MGERHNGLKKYLKDKHFEINMYYNPDNGMPVSEKVMPRHSWVSLSLIRCVHLKG